MNVGQVMTRTVYSCQSTDSLNRVAQIMWENDCGCVPVEDAAGRAIAMITDRDICMAAYTRGLPLTQISVGSAASRTLHCVLESDSLTRAELLMQRHRVRRLPVVDGDGRPVGILSMNDLARRVRDLGSDVELGPAAITRTLAFVCAPDRAHAPAGVANLERSR